MFDSKIFTFLNFGFTLIWLFPHGIRKYVTFKKGEESTGKTHRNVKDNLDHGVTGIG